jgi:hypothetical protein
MNIPINDFATVGLDEMDSLRLMDRVDTKFVAAASLLPQLLEAMRPLFRIQIIDDRRMADYATQYLDTPALDCYLMHQNGKLNRRKIRIRSYLDSNLSFLEIKNKNNRGRTDKKRIPTAVRCISSIEEFNSEEKNFIEQRSRYAADSLAPVLENRFRRMTFVNVRASERITVDIHLSFFNRQTGNAFQFDNLAILELKQDSLQRSDFKDILSRLRIRPCSFSKYCTGTFLTNPDAKYNRFKTKMHIINKIIR